jgi:ribonuclease BN (tRNA processing enzyme)
MEFTSIATGSAGNGYILQSEEAVLIIEAGKGLFKKILANIPKDKKISGLIYTHLHLDHYGDVPKFREITEVFYFDSKNRYENDDFIIKRYKVLHNVECWAMAIFCKSEQKTMIFATDFVKVIDKEIYNFKPDFIAVELSYNEMIAKKMSEKDQYGLMWHSSDFHTIGFLRKFFNSNSAMKAVTIHKSERACNYGLTNKQLFENFGLRAEILTEGKKYKF